MVVVDVLDSQTAIANQIIEVDVDYILSIPMVWKQVRGQIVRSAGLFGVQRHSTGSQERVQY
ncbi:MAG: hypothetical protein DWB48_07140 [Nitrosomonas sp.]|nr:hypothetical protein [Nitrosomonas sp.]